MWRVITLCCCAMLLGSPARAATLEPAQGTLSINQGEGFRPVNARVDANVGDSVMVAPGGSATLVYDDGCKVDVQPGAITTIAPLSPCASGSYAQDNSTFNATAAGAVLVFGAVAGTLIYEGTKTSASPGSP